MIYTEYWGLSFPPFANDNRPETFIPTRAAALAIGRLRYSLGMGMGASALFGEPGVGKSRVARVIMAEFADARWRVGYMPNPSGLPRDILGVLDPAAATLVPLGMYGLTELQAFLTLQAKARKPVLLVVDDVQTVRGSDFLEILRTLLNVEADGVKALSILLIGQASMERRLALASGFDSQLLMRAVLDPMTDEETRLYILARLKSAGSKQGIFTKHAAERVVQLTRGNPRQINRLCELALVVAYGLDEKKVSPDVIELAAADLDLLPPGEASFFPWPHPAPETPPPEEEPPPEEDILASLTAEETKR